MTQPSAIHAAAADGCKTGWIALNHGAGGTVQAELCTNAAEDLVTRLRNLERMPQVLLIDMPIGLPDQGSRHCDQLARGRLGARRSSIFPAPIRPVLQARSWEEACAIREACEGKRISKRSWNITAKVREVDGLLQGDPTLRGWLTGGASRLSFSLLAGAPLPHSKKTPSGQALRLRLVEHHFGSGSYTAVREQFSRSQVGDDDILDAFAALWSADRLIQGRGLTLPLEPELDATGLCMEINA